MRQLSSELQRFTGETAVSRALFSVVQSFCLFVVVVVVVVVFYPVVC